MNPRLKTVLFYILNTRSIILAFGVFNFILIRKLDWDITTTCAACPWYHSWNYLNEPSLLLAAGLFLWVGRWWGNVSTLLLSGYVLGYVIWVYASYPDGIVAGLRLDWTHLRRHYPYFVGSWESQYVFALFVFSCAAFYLARTILERNPSRPTADNNSLQVSAG
jgi:hypothetical protein